MCDDLIQKIVPALFFDVDFYIWKSFLDEPMSSHSHVPRM